MAAVVDPDPGALGIQAQGLGVAIAGVVTPGIGQGIASGKALEAMARQPEMYGKIQTNMILAMALMEALAIYGLLISFMLVAKI